MLLALLTKRLARCTQGTISQTAPTVAILAPTKSSCQIQGERTRRHFSAIDYAARRSDTGSINRQHEETTCSALACAAGALWHYDIYPDHCRGYSDVSRRILAIFLAPYRRGSLPVLCAVLLDGRQRGKIITLCPVRIFTCRDSVDAATTRAAA